MTAKTIAPDARRSAASPATETAPSTATRTGAGSAPRRESFALTGRSVLLDPRTNAVRADLADVRLADQVFAPHYAEPLSRTLMRSASLFAEPRNGETLVELASGDRFEVLELVGGRAWGIAPGPGLVGYIDAGALAA